MILFVSGRTDVVAFYMKWFMNSFHRGYIDTRNPFNEHLVSRIYFKDVDLILFCTKNPLPLIPYLDEFKIPILVHVTLTPYMKDIEPNVIEKTKIIEGIKVISKKIGRDNIYLRYDPILLNDKYTINYHIKAFDRLVNLVSDSVKHIIISFIDIYKNVLNNMKYLKLKEITNDDKYFLAKAFKDIINNKDMDIRTCAEDIDLRMYGYINEGCLSKELAFKLTNKKYSKQSIRKDTNCNCVRMVDIGSYNSCPHLCKYCYANYDESKVIENFNNHVDNSSLLIGEISELDIIKERFK